MICRLCFDTKALSELSRTTSGHITDVCLVCRERELRAVLAQVEAILALDDRLANPRHPDGEETQTIQRKNFDCGHIDDGCWCLCCHYCEDVMAEFTND